MIALRYYREKRGLTQKDLASLLNSHQGRISDIELGKETPNARLLDELAAALDVSPAFLLLRPIVVKQDVVFADSNEQVSA